ncbi:MAG: SUMF1/EgtB/PvdO family nonheme iron enzyme [Planctomycetes bacterium]|nr:SUMF1/EgtB/PvdO family nonheme iron enzyme [Planctomycetota bacterium]
MQKIMLALSLLLACVLPLHAEPPAKAIGLSEALSAVPANLRTPNRWALVIGASAYQDKRIPQLPACANDAKALAAVLSDPGIGMFPPDHVTLLVNDQVTRDKVVAALDDLGRHAGKDDLVLVFFSGHGATDEKGRAYWVMGNTQVDQLRATAVLEADVTELLSEIKTTRLVTLIDACYSRATANLGQSKSLLDLSKIYPEFKGDGRIAMTASKGDQLSVVIRDAKSPGLGYSAFAWHAIQGIKGEADGDGDGVITVDELWGYVKDRTEETARREGGNQEPQLKGQFGSKFLLAVNAEHLRRSMAETATARELREKRLASLKQLALNHKITVDQFGLGERLITTLESDMDEFDRRRLVEFAALLDNRLAPEKLQIALDLIETPTQREARLAREAAELAARQKQSRIAQLLATAKTNDNKEHGQAALAALDELLTLAPGHAEAGALREKIGAYYGPRTLTNSIGAKLVEIRAGEFLMGSPAGEEGHTSGETQHKVQIARPFMMGVTEVTQAQWRAVMGNNPSRFKGDDLPVEQVSWEDAQEFCRKLSEKEGKKYRLPTEAEWEYACRAGTGEAFGGTGNLDDMGWSGDNSGRSRLDSQRLCDTVSGNYISRLEGNGNQTHPVGQKRANAWGLYDMHGNVWEWCEDKYDATSRVMRGGSWCIFPRDCRSAYRNWGAPGTRSCSIGFRLVLDF